MKYLSTYWITKLAVKHQKNDYQIKIEELLPAVTKLTRHLEFLLNDQGDHPNDVEEMFKTLISDELASHKFSNIVIPAIIKAASERGMKIRGEKIAESLTGIRKLFEKNKNFYLDTFSFLIKKHNDNFIDTYMDCISKITRDHLEEIIINIQDYTRGFKRKRPDEEESNEREVKLKVSEGPI